MNKDMEELISQLSEAIENPRCIDREKAIRYHNAVMNMVNTNIILRKNAEHNDHVVDSARWTTRILEGRIKKAVEHLEIKQARYRNEEDYNINDKDLLDIEQILMGEYKDGI